jgi:hypothetical protein
MCKGRGFGLNDWSSGLVVSVLRLDWKDTRVITCTYCYYNNTSSTMPSIKYLTVVLLLFVFLLLYTAWSK